MRIALSLMRAVVDPRCDLLAVLTALADAMRELVALPGGKERLAVVVR